MVRILSILAIVIAATSAQASILIEPYVGAGSSTFTGETKDTPSTEYSLAGTPSVFGARLGYSILGLWMAADYTSMSGSMTFDKPKALLNDSSSSFSSTFIDVGFNFPFLLRVWAGYGFSPVGKYSFTDKIVGNNYDLTFKGGSAIKAGIGFKLFMFFSVNVEYIKPTYTKYEETIAGVSQTTDDALDTSWKSADFSTTMVTLSFPLSLL